MNIFISKNGTRQGPYSIEQLKGLIARGDISMTDMAWCEGSPTWTRISETPELVQAILPALPVGPSANSERTPACQKSPPSSAEPQKGDSLPEPVKAVESQRLGTKVSLRTVVAIDVLFVMLLVIYSAVKNSDLQSLAGILFWLNVALGLVAFVATFLAVTEHANEWAGPKLFSFGRDHIFATGSIIFAVGMAISLAAFGLALLGIWALAGDGFPGNRWAAGAFFVGSIALSRFGFRAMKLGWKGVRARKVRR